MMYTQWPPMYAWTPYQMHAARRLAPSQPTATKEEKRDEPMAARLKTGHKLPQIPNEDLLTTGKPMWYVAPMRPVEQMKQAEMAYPIQTHSHDCHHESPPWIMDDEIIQVLMLNESAIQKPTKFQGPHWRRSGSTGLRSWLVNCERAPISPLCHEVLDTGAGSAPEESCPSDDHPGRDVLGAGVDGGEDQTAGRQRFAPSTEPSLSQARPRRPTFRPIC